MAITVETKDAGTLGDSELADMADMCVESPVQYEAGFLSKEKDKWVLISQVRDKGRLLGFSFCSLERIGGTPCLLLGTGSIKRHSKRDAAVKAMLADLHSRAVMSFPDEDVLIGSRFISPSGFLLFKGLQDAMPRSGHKPTGEERAWVRRLAKRFDCEATADDRTSVVKGSDYPCGVFDYDTLKPEKISADLDKCFKVVKPKKGDSLIGFGWAMAEQIAGGKLSR